MKILLSPLRWIYLLLRRLAIIDVTWLLHMSAGEFDIDASPCSEGKLSRYEIRMVPIGELAELRRSELVHPQVGDFRELDKKGRALVGAFDGSRLVAFAWFAKQAVAGRDNYSRSIHLGTSIDLPDDSAFVYNVWTDPEHRGNRLMPELLRWAIRNRIAGGWSLSATVDWANDRSCHLFEQLGMQKLGLIVRIGHGPLQVSLFPSSAKRFGLRVASDAPGFKVAV